MTSRDLTEQTPPGGGLLRRDPDHGRLGGVCAGVSAHTGIDLRLVRISTVVLGLSGGLGVALYACGWLLLPTTTDDGIPLASVAPSTQAWDPHRRLVVTAVVGGVTWLLLGSWLPLAPVPVILGLVLVLAQRHGARAAARTAARPTAATLGPAGQSATTHDFHAALGAWQARVDQVASGGASTPLTTPAHPMDAVGWSPSLAELSARPLAPTAPPHVPAPGATAIRLPARPRRRTSWAASLVVAGLAWLGYRLVLDARLGGAAGMPRHHLELAITCSLAVVGAALVVLGFSRVQPRLLVTLGLVLLCWLGVVHAGVVDDHGRWQAQRSGAGTAADPARFVGVDTTLPVPATASGRTIVVVARAAHVVVIVPSSLPVEVDYQVRAADVQVGSTHVSGSTTGSLPLSGTTRTTPVTIEVDAVASQVEVRHG